MKKPVMNNGILYDKIENILNNDSELILEDTAWITAYEPYSGTYFHTSPALLLWAELQLNKELHRLGEVSVGYFLKLLGLPRCDEYNGVGWTMESMMNKWHDDCSACWINIFNHHVLKDHIPQVSDPLADNDYYELFYLEDPETLEDD